MLPFGSLIRRHRYIIACLVAIPFLFYFRHTSGQPSVSTSKYRTGGLGTNTWDDSDWVDDSLVGNRFADHTAGGGGKWLPWTKPGRSILVTGGAGSLGHAIIPKLLNQGYIVHVADFVPQPVTLPKDVLYHRVDIRTSALGEILEHTQYDGVLHFAGVSLEGWCLSKPEECTKVNVGGTKNLMEAIEVQSRKAAGSSGAWTRGVTVPWIVYASSTEVYGNPDKGTIEESSATNPESSIGKTSLAAEELVRDAFDRSRRGKLAGEHKQRDDDEDADADDDSEGGSTVLRGAVIRLSQVYGFARESAIPSAFIPHLLQRSVSSLPIQYSSDEPASDFLHVNDAIDGILRVIDFVGRSEGGEALETFNLVKGGKRWMQQEVVDLMRAETKTMSPLRDIGDKKATVSSAQYSSKRANDVLAWTPAVDLPLGLALATTALAEDSVEYANNFLSRHCPQYGADVGAMQTPAVPEDQRNRDLWKLHNCTVNLGFNHDGWLHHVKCQDGKNCGADNKKVVSYNWNATVWNIHVVPESHSSNGRAQVKFAQENGAGWLGIRKTDIAGGGEVEWALFRDNDPEPFVNTFEVEVAPDSSALRIMLPGTQPQPIYAHSKGEETIFNLETIEAAVTEPHYDMRINMLCCQSEGDWPLLLDDHESADQRFGNAGDIAFNASRRLHLCERAHAAQQLYTTMIETSRKLVDEVSAQTGDAKSKSAPPYTVSRHPHNWPLKPLEPCWNDCNSPTTCVQTGNCRCVQADNCPRRRENPLIVLARGMRPTDQKKVSPLGDLGSFDPVLRKMVEKVDWRDILLPEARAYYAAHPELIKVHVVSGYEGEKEVEASPCHKLQKTHCFSADSIMYRAMRHVSVPATEATLVVLPVYQHCVDNEQNSADFLLHKVWSHATNTIKNFYDDKVPLVMMTHDWGICLSFTWEIWSSREMREGKPTLYPDHLLDNTIVFSVMGDWDTRCYRPAQDIVVPARTCLSEQLKDRFSDIHNVAPAHERPQLITWSGTFWGTGKTERLRLACHRGGVADEELVSGGGPQSSFYNWEYLKELNAARFCPQPKGIAGKFWQTSHSSAQLTQLFLFFLQAGHPVSTTQSTPAASPSSSPRARTTPSSRRSTGRSSRCASTQRSWTRSSTFSAPSRSTASSSCRPT